MTSDAFRQAMKFYRSRSDQIDLAPDAMYDEILAHGTRTLD